VRAEVQTDMLILGRAEFARCLPENSSLSYAIMRGLVHRLRAADRQIESLALLDVYGRVARTLLDMSEMDGELKIIRNKVSRQDLAKVVGASREMVSRVMKDLEGRGMVQTQEKRLGRHQGTDRLSFVAAATADLDCVTDCRRAGAEARAAACVPPQFPHDISSRFPACRWRRIDGHDDRLLLPRRQPCAAPSAHSPGLIRAQFRLLVGAVLFVLALLALATHNGLDPAFSTSGSGGHVSNKAGVVGAWFSDFAFFLFGYSFWWVLVVGARAWLGALARVLRSESHLAPPRPAEQVPAGLPGSAWRCCWQRAPRSSGRGSINGRGESPAAMRAACSATCSARRA
jgi:hypothetical protein